MLDDEETTVKDLASGQPQPRPQQPLATRAPQDGAQVTDMQSDVVDTAGSEYFGPTAWCELPRRGSKARRLAHGKGELKLANGSKYVGSFEYGQRHGHGKWWSEEGDVYEGGWRDDTSFGEGTLTFKAGGYCSGLWAHGVMNGPGTKVDPDGTKYEGGFYRDLYHGFGKEYEPDGTLWREGEWKDGFEVDAKPKPAAKKKDFKLADRVRPPHAPPTRLPNGSRACWIRAAA